MNTSLKSLTGSSALIAACLIGLGSCTLEKRLYTSGFHLEWHNKKHHSLSPADGSKAQSPLPAAAPHISVHDSIAKASRLPSPIGPLTASSDQKLFPSGKSVHTDPLHASSRHQDFDASKERRRQAGKMTDPGTAVQPEDDLKKQKSLLSTLWTFVSLNYLYCDLVGLMDAGKLTQYLAGTVDGLVMSQGFLLAAAIFIEIPMIMILLSRVLKGKGNRQANIVAGVIMTVVQLATLFLGPVSMYYLFFSIIEIATTAFIVWYAWKKFPKPGKV